MINFSGAAQPLQDDDIQSAALKMNCHPAAIKAILDVESRGSGFDINTKRPIILFEPHILYRELGSNPEMQRYAIEAGLASKKWNPKLYTNSQDGRYEQLSRAMELDPEAALRACSWGLGQIMGFNTRLAGYRNVEEFTTMMVQSEGAQLDAMINFIMNSDLDDEIREGRWADFANRYNGPSYAENEYDRKLEAAFREHSSDPSLFWRRRAPARPKVYRVGMSGGIVADIHEALTKAGIKFQPMQFYSSGTAKMVRDFQATHNLVPDGIAGPATLGALGITI